MASRRRKETAIAKKLRMNEEAKVKPTKLDFSKTGYNDTDRLLLSAVEQAYNAPSKRIRFINEFRLNPLSNDKVAVYQNVNSKEIIFAIKGTSSKKEVLLDLKLALSKGINTTQLNNVVGDFSRVQQSYPEYSIYLTGHSLGGIKAMLISSKHPHIQGTVFNTFWPETSGLNGPLRNILTKQTAVKMVSAEGDPLSNEGFKYRRDIVKLSPPFLQRNIIAHLTKTLKRF